MCHSSKSPLLWAISICRGSDATVRFKYYISSNKVYIRVKYNIDLQQNHIIIRMLYNSTSRGRELSSSLFFLFGKRFSRVYFDLIVINYSEMHSPGVVASKNVSWKSLLSSNYRRQLPLASKESIKMLMTKNICCGQTFPCISFRSKQKRTPRRTHFHFCKPRWSKHRWFLPQGFCLSTPRIATKSDKTNSCAPASFVFRRVTPNVLLVEVIGVCTCAVQLKRSPCLMSPHGLAQNLKSVCEEELRPKRKRQGGLTVRLRFEEFNSNGLFECWFHLKHCHVHTYTCIWIWSRASFRYGEWNFGTNKPATVWWELPIQMYQHRRARNAWSMTRRSRLRRRRIASVLARTSTVDIIESLHSINPWVDCSDNWLSMCCWKTRNHIHMDTMRKPRKPRGRSPSARLAQFVISKPENQIHVE